MAAATRVIAAQGLSAPTAVIAREAGISNGSLFTYFETKADLFNSLYLELKTGMAVASLEGVPASAPLLDQFATMWANWMRWATSHPEQRRALEDRHPELAGDRRPVLAHEGRFESAPLRAGDPIPVPPGPRNN